MTAPCLDPSNRPLRRVVIADGDADTRALYREALDGLYLDIVEVADGRDALVQCLLQRPSLLIADSHLAIIDGYHLCRVLRQDGVTATVPILVVTSESRPAERTRLRQQGATSVLSKPIALDGFHAAVRSLCDGVHVAEVDAARVAYRPASRVHQRFETTAPPEPPPELRCKHCDHPLAYQSSRVGGVSSTNPEQWDVFRCPQCVRRFEFRHRTHTLREAK